MRYRLIGRTNIRVSSIGFGTWALAGDFTWGPQDEEDARAALRSALEEGVTFFDTAPSYGEGRAERLLGEVLAPVRDRVAIATKVSPDQLEPKALRASCERSLENLNTEYIDLLQIHWPNPQADMEQAFETLAGLRDAGKIRAFGVSNFGCKDLAPCLKRREWMPASNQLAYNLLFRAIEYEIQPFCVKNDIAILCYSPLLHGMLSGKYLRPDDVPPERARTRHFSKARPHTRHGEEGAEAETFAAIEAIRQVARDLEEPMASVALSWLLAQEGVASAIVGARDAIQARRNARAGNLALPPAIVKKLSAVTEPLKRKLGPNPDMWETPPRIH
jgi:aryl-alcohol dehydrogenase-like predicted oxidoreductase